MSADELERIRRIKQAHEKLWLALESVTAVGIGTTSSGKAGLIVSVMDDPGKMRGQIPRSIDGIEVEIRFSGELKAQ
ncbi:MAG: hypothetical protein KF749_10140 [Bacteroidetes bacterium]|nr:hypothetical protein [Bacteroidota bacterium]MCW5896677.1 hypothetical protein [Bacteroidota bacterium]